jgi:predicted O-methyltransferase YrrM
MKRLPSKLTAIEEATRRLGFSMASDRRTGMLLRALAASKRGGSLLELGTGTGVSACWLLDGMDADARLVTVDNDATVLGIARGHLGDDPRIRILNEDGAEFLASVRVERFDLIFADAWPGKFTDLDRALALLAPGGLYVIDDLLPQPSWPEGHAPRVPELVAELESRAELAVVDLDWATGVVIAARLDLDRTNPPAMSAPEGEADP